MKESHEPIYYYEYDHLTLLAKRGKRDAPRDIYCYDPEEKQWDRHTIESRRWWTLGLRVQNECERVSVEELRQSNVPLIKKYRRDITTQLLENAKKRSKK